MPIGLALCASQIDLPSSTGHISLAVLYKNSSTCKYSSRKPLLINTNFDIHHLQICGMSVDASEDVLLRTGFFVMHVGFGKALAEIFDRAEAMAAYL